MPSANIPDAIEAFEGLSTLGKFGKVGLGGLLGSITIGADGDIEFSARGFILGAASAVPVIGNIVGIANAFATYGTGGVTGRQRLTYGNGKGASGDSKRRAFNARELGQLHKGLQAVVPDTGALFLWIAAELDFEPPPAHRIRTRFNPRTGATRDDVEPASLSEWWERDKLADLAMRAYVGQRDRWTDRELLNALRPTRRGAPHAFATTAEREFLDEWLLTPEPRAQVILEAVGAPTAVPVKVLEVPEPAGRADEPDGRTGETVEVAAPRFVTRFTGDLDAPDVPDSLPPDIGAGDVPPETPADDGGDGDDDGGDGHVALIALAALVLLAVARG